ncbi:MAG: TonB-dependent receptor [Terracidiphilus sp.]
MKSAKSSVLFFRQIAIAAALLGAAAFASAQAGRGGISGLVSDPTGAIIPGASVTATDAATGAKLSTVTTGAGLYTFVSLPPGTYQVAATAKGFDTVVQKNVPVSVDQVTTINLSLKVGQVSEVVTVTETTSLVDTSNSTVGQLISADTIDRVPLLTRNVYDLIQLSAGVTPANGANNSSSSFAIENISSGRPGVDVSSYTVNGAIEGSVYYMVDGSPLGIAENNAAAIIPAMDLPEDDVDEVRVETQNTPATYQSGAAGVISLATKSGSDKFHGDAFGVFRPNALSANEWFNKQSQIENGQPNAPLDYHRYQEGGAIGGPIKHGKLYFFGDYEDTQEERYDGSNYFVVPTTAERSGDFSADAFTIYDPTKPDNPDGTRQAFPLNKIPTPNPTGLKFLSEMPKCNIGPNCDASSDDLTYNFFQPGLDPNNGRKFDVRIDWAKSDKQRIFGRFSFDRLLLATFNAFGNMWDLNYAQNLTNGRDVLVADDYTLNPTTVLQLRYSFVRHHENQGGDPSQNGFNITQLGFPASLAAQEVYKLLPFVVFDDNGGGVGGTADYNTFQYASENSDAIASITKAWGKHELAAGFEYMKRFLNVGQPIAPSGEYSFDISATDQSVSSANGGSDFASLLIGMGEYPGNETNDYPNFSKDLFEAESNPYYAGFVEDTWRPASSFSVTAGLRWDIFAGRTERHNRLEYFDPTAKGSANGVSYTGAEEYVNSGSRSAFTTNLTNLGPRLGASWQVYPNLLFRGGAGMYYGPSPEMAGSASLDSDGFASYTAWNATCTNGDGNTVFNGDPACNGGVSTPDVFTGPNSLSNPFPGGLVPTFTTPPAGLANNLGISLATVLHSQRTPTVYNYNFGLEWQMPRQVVLSAAYVGSRGLFLPFGGIDLNTLSLEQIAQYGYSLCVDPSQPTCKMVPNTWAPIQPSTNNNYGASMVPLWVALQAYPQFGNGGYGSGNGIIVNGDPAGDSEYNSLQTKLQKHLTKHFETLASFTWAKLITDDGNPPLGFVGSHNGGAQDTQDLYLEHSVSPQDVKYQFTGEVSYDLPVGAGRAVNLHGFANAALGGWTTNTIVYLSTGVPIPSPGTGTSPSYFAQRANMTCNPGAKAPRTSADWFDMTCFSFPSSPLVPGTAPAYIDGMRTAGAHDVDVSLYKEFKFGEDRVLRFDISSYNLFNYAQFGMPNVSSLTVPANFGLITGTVNSPRQFQFGSRFTF